jgi:formylglycine-generating enzyme required for sulfatase activity
MSCLADLPELVGFFSYSREDDNDSNGALSALRGRIQGELRGQLGRTTKTFRLWQDKEAIPSGSLWESEIKNAVAQSAFFIPIITPTVVASQYCRFELESFLAREAEIGRNDLVFPILYIDVPALHDSVRRQHDLVLSLIAKRQYVDWRKLRHRDAHTTDVSEAVEQFCTHIRDALHRSWIPPEERAAQETAAALQRAEDDRKRKEAEAQRKEEEAQRKAAEVRAREHAEEERRQRETEAEQRRAEERRVRDEAQAKLRADEEQRRAEREGLRRQRRLEARPWPLSRPALVGASVVGLVLITALGIWLAEPSKPIAVNPEAPSPVTPVPSPSAPTEQAKNAPLSPAQERALKSRATFQECSKCPVMAVIPPGSFTMGLSANEPDPGADGNVFRELASPAHGVTIGRQFAVAQFALTFDEWDACVADNGCDGYSPSDGGWGRGRRPVINVSFDHAKAYVAWISTLTGKSYRLLSEAEYEYAARASTQTAYPWGNTIGKNNANCDGCGSSWDKRQTAPVGSFAPNQFGLYDMVGNAGAWTEDCWHDDYKGAPTDGSAWTFGDCGRNNMRQALDHVFRGGSWWDPPLTLRSAYRNGGGSFYQDSERGFRIARTLLPP